MLISLTVATCIAEPPTPSGPPARPSETSFAPRVDPSSSVAAPTTPASLDPRVGESELPVAGDNALLPVAVGLTWTYESTTENQAPQGRTSVDAIVATELFGDETAWVLERGFGSSEPTRWILVDRGGDWWAVAIDQPNRTRWERQTLDPPVLFRPAVGVRSWTKTWLGFTEQRDVFTYSERLTQRRGDVVEVFGTEHAEWTIVSNRRIGGRPSTETITLAEGIGTVHRHVETADGTTNFDLTGFGTELPELNGIWHGFLLRAETWIRLNRANGGIEILDGPARSNARNWQINPTGVRFTLTTDGVEYAIDTTLRPWGLIGTATDASGLSYPVELVRDGGLP